MSFCKNCGYQLGNDEKFCANCGTSAGSIQPNLSNSTTNHNGTNAFITYFNVYTTEILNVAVNIVKKPISTITSVSSTLKKESPFVLLAILSIFYGLLNIWNIKAVVSSALKSTPSFFSSDIGLGDLVGYFISNIMTEIYHSIPFGKIFFITLLFFIICILVLFAANYLIGKYTFKTSVNATNLLMVTTCSSIPFIISCFIQAILSYISITLGLIVIFIALILSLICLFKGTAAELKLSEDKVAFIIPISCLIMFLVNYIFFSLIIKSLL